MIDVQAMDCILDLPMCSANYHDWLSLADDSSKLQGCASKGNPEILVLKPSGTACTFKLLLGSKQRTFEIIRTSARQL